MLAEELDTARRRGRRLDYALERARVLDRASDLERIRMLDLALESAREHARALARARAGERVRNLDLAFERALDCALDRARDRADEVIRWLDTVRVDASGVDLSGLTALDRDALAGVTWTRETTWPAGVAEWVRARSREIRPGVFQVHDGTERDPADAVTV